ncbi:helix-turn-helix transcriptional regulator [Stutzerimonas nitrititolerans]|uniref:helix-turn-helix transcriptional regulator n=1 Tax=Stutzerimonas nitrititolerans TaxID=2482751 RepID=UPI0021D43D1F|nr:helix-turn-helix domain-containing protein [Stutzerimonas nitrititolerans]
MPHSSHRSARPLPPGSVPPHRRLGSPPSPKAAEDAGAASRSHYLNNDEAADFLRLSPRTLEKQRVIGGGPRFRKFGRRVMYALADLQAWADARCFETTFDPAYLERHPGGARDER